MSVPEDDDYFDLEITPDPEKQHEPHVSSQESLDRQMLVEQGQLLGILQGQMNELRTRTADALDKAAAAEKKAEQVSKRLQALRKHLAFWIKEPD